MKNTRICIAGGPKTGKTTLAHEARTVHGVEVRSTDDLIADHDWSECSRIVAEDWFAQPGPWVIEGVAVPRALRKWLKGNPTGRPCDVVVYREGEFEALSTGQARMTAGVATVWREVSAELSARGVMITDDPRALLGGDGTGGRGSVL